MATMIPQSGGGGDLIYPELDSEYRTHAKKKIAPLEIIDLDNDNTPFRCANWGNPANYGGSAVSVYDFDSNNNLTFSRTGNNTSQEPFMHGTDPVVYSRYIDKYIRVKSGMNSTSGSSTVYIYLHVGNDTLQSMGNTANNTTLHSIAFNTGMTPYSGKEDTGVVVNACTKGKYLYIAFVVLCPDSSNTSSYPKMNLYVVVVDLDDYSIYRSREFTSWRSQYKISEYGTILTGQTRNIGIYYNFLYQDKIYMNLCPYQLGKDVMNSYPGNSGKGYTIIIDYNNISATNDAVQLIISDGSKTGTNHFYPSNIGAIGYTTLENSSPANAIEGHSIFVKDHELYYLSMTNVDGVNNTLKCAINVYKIGVPAISQDGYLYYTGLSNQVHKMCVPISGRLFIPSYNSYPTTITVLPVNLIKKYIGFAITSNVNSITSVYDLSTYFYDINAILDKTEKIQDIDTIPSANM